MRPSPANPAPAPGRTRTRWRVQWPEPPLHVALFEPEIPPNTGAIARLCAATGTPLHLVGPLGFRLTDRALRRAGLDYWDSVDLRRHTGYDGFEAALPGHRMFFFSTSGRKPYTAETFRPGDVLVFGPESRGLPADLLEANADRVLGIPMRNESVRSLNLATAVAIALFEALRQVAHTGTEPESGPA